MKIIDKVIGVVDNIMSVKLTLPPVNPILLAAGSKKRSGLSAKKITAEIIKKRGEIGAWVGPMPDGTANIEEQLEFIRVEAIINALQQDARIDVAMDPGAISITGTGGNAGGPVEIIGQSINTPSGTGTIM
jgi:hypothetical protein